MLQSGESVSPLNPVEAALDAVKAYIRMNRAGLAADGELLALLLPERFAQGQVSDLQRFAIERMAAEIRALKIECDALKGSRDHRAKLGEGVRRLVLDLIGVDGACGVIATAIGGICAFGADMAAICLESRGFPALETCDGVCSIPQGTVSAVVGPNGTGAILSGGGELLFGPSGAPCNSLAAFRLRLGEGAPPALYVLGAFAEGGFEGREIESDLGYFARALERALRAKLNEKWLDQAKV